MATTHAGDVSSPDHGAGPGLLASKLARPRTQLTFVSRPHVDGLLDAGNLLPLTVVTAGPGWGKTLAVADWARRAGEGEVEVAWVSLDEGDNDPRRFWTYVLAALRSTRVPPAGSPLAELAPGMASELTYLDRFMAGLAQLPVPVTLVLDDFQVLHDQQLLAGVGTLLHQRLETLRVVLLTRADPALPLHRLRVTGSVAEVRSRDLAFSEDEATALLASHGVPVDSDGSRQLIERTEGWPAGLRLAALFLRRHEGAHAIAEFTGNDQAVTGYLAEEVLGSQTPQMQQFLLHSSIVERLNGDLAGVLTGQPDSQQQLEQLAGSQAFVVELGPARQWFRYHALLREMLLHRLRRDAPETVPDLHRRAATWYGEHGYPIEAMTHAADAQDWGLVGRLFVQTGASTLVTSQRVAMGQMLARIPNDRLADTPELAMCGAARSFLEGRYTDITAHLDRARHLLRDHAPADDNTRVVLLLLAVTVARTQGDMVALERDASEAIDIISTSGRLLPLADAYRGIARGNLAVSLLWSGRIGAAEAQLREADAASERSGTEVAQVNVRAHLGLAATARGRLGEGFAHARAAVDLVEARGWAPLVQAATAYLALATILLRRNDADGAREVLAAGHAAAARERVSRLALALTQVRLEASLGRTEEAKRLLWMLERDLAERPPPALLARWLAITRAELDLAMGSPDTALPRIARAEDREPPYAEELVCVARALLASGRPEDVEDTLAPLLSGDGQGMLPEAWLLVALATDHLRQDNRATQALARALDAAAADGVVRPLVAWGGTRLPVLLVRLAELDPAHADAAHELASYLRLDGVTDPAETLAEALTDRELMVLRFLPTMKTNPEIAADLFVSVNTVKAHLKRIFRKLGVESRREAVHRARDLGLIGRAPTTSQDRTAEF